MIEIIETLVREGRHPIARARIRKLAADGLNDVIRLRLSDWYLRMGLSQDALRILGPELSEAELREATHDQIRLQIRLTYLLSYFEAYKSAYRVLRKLRSVVQSSPQLLISYLRSLGGLHTRRYEYVQAADTYRQILLLMDPTQDFYNFQMMKLGLADNLDGQGDTEQAVHLADAVIESALSEQIVLKAISYQARGEYFFNADIPGESRSDFDQAQRLFPKDLRSRDYAFLCKWSGAWHSQYGNPLVARQELLQALKIMTADRLRPTNILEVYFWLAQVPLTTSPELWTLQTHPSLNPYGYLMGRKRAMGVALHPWIQNRMINRLGGEDIWILKNSLAQPARYIDSIHQVPRHLDLISGISTLKSEAEVLTPLKSRALLALAASGTLGLSDWCLADQIYDEFDYSSSESLLLKMNDLVFQLRRSGFQIMRRRNQFYWIPPQGISILIPMDQVYQGPLERVKKTRRTFIRQDIEQDFRVSPATAKRWIADWLTQNKIRSEGVGKRVKYAFIALEQ